VTLTTLLFENFFGDHVGTFPRSMLAKFEVRTLSHFGAISVKRPKIYGVTWPWPRPLFEKFFRGHNGTFHGSMSAKSEVRIFNRYEAISI